MGATGNTPVPPRVPRPRLTGVGSPRHCWSPLVHAAAGVWSAHARGSFATKPSGVCVWARKERTASKLRNRRACGSPAPADPMVWYPGASTGVGRTTFAAECTALTAAFCILGMERCMWACTSHATSTVSQCASSLAAGANERLWRRGDGPGGEGSS